MFTHTSRYADIEVARYQPPDGGVVIPYVRRRVLPMPETLTVIAAHVVGPDDRIDRLAARYFSDPERYWQIADANPVLDPAELTARQDRRLVIALPGATAGGSRGF